MNFTSYLMSNVKFALKMGAGAIVFSLLIISSSIDLEFGMFWSIVGFVVASIYNLPEYLRYKKREYSYKRNQRKAEKLEKQRLNEIRRNTALYLQDLNQMIQEVEFMSDGDNLYSFDLNEKIIYKTNDDAVMLLQKWKSDLEQIMANHWDKEINQFYENTISTFKQNIYHSSLNTESIYEYFKTLNIPEMYKQILRDPHLLKSELNKVEILNKELNQDFKRLQRGVLGEQVVEKELLKYQGDYMTLFGNRIDMGEDGTVENDVLIFSENGIFTLEVKNIKSTGDQYLKISKDGLWYERNSLYSEWQVDEKSSRIVDQVNRHVYLTQKFVTQTTTNKVHVQPIIVISNDNVVIENETEWIIVRPNQIYSCIRNAQRQFTRDQAEEYYRLFEKYDIGQAKFQLIDYGYQIERVTSHLHLIEQSTKLISRLNSIEMNRS